MVLSMIMVMIVLKVPRRSAQADDEEALNKETLPRCFSFLVHAPKASILQQLKKQNIFELQFEQRR